MTKIKSLNELENVRGYLARIGAEPRSLKTAVVKEVFGKYWTDTVSIRFYKDGNITCSNEAYAPTDKEREKMAEELQNADWPQLLPIKELTNLPQPLKQEDPKNVFEFRDLQGMIVMVQQRVEDEEGNKNYLPWTYWDDKVWRRCEPDDALPLYNAHRLREASTVFIHEGAKGARNCQWMVDAETRAAREALGNHPWGTELNHCVHVGWIGGALNPSRTDWSLLKKVGVTKAYIVADNDKEGKQAIPGISERLHCKAFSIEFTDEFPPSFDLGDPFPETMFKHLEGVPVYQGPKFRECLHPATWATKLIPNPKGKPSVALRDVFKDLWAYVEQADIFVCTEMPELVLSESVLNRHAAPFAHTNNVAQLLVREYRGRSARICYRPDHEGRTVTFRGSSAINLHIPPDVKPFKGDPSPWQEFLDYMFVNPEERKEVERWCATLIARPETRIGYGLLLVSERQGVGKTTLGAHILAPLVGLHNVGFPNETEIGQSQFNDWVANKRLVVVNEIYSGASWKAYHQLKSVITDRDVTVNQKYMRPYTIENWCHVMACSNSMRALKMENDDRRWFYPEVTEVPWPRQKFTELRAWIESGGLRIIKHWADNYGDYIDPSEKAPMTERKREMIEGSRSEGQKEAVALAEMLKDKSEPSALLIKDVVAWVRSVAQGRVFDSDYELRKAMTETGVRCWPKRIKVYGRVQYALVNDALWDHLQRQEPSAVMSELRAKVVKPNELMEAEM